MKVVKMTTNTGADVSIIIVCDAVVKFNHKWNAIKFNIKNSQLTKNKFELYIFFFLIKSVIHFFQYIHIHTIKRKIHHIKNLKNTRKVEENHSSVIKYLIMTAWILKSQIDIKANTNQIKNFLLNMFNFRYFLN